MSGAAAAETTSSTGTAGPDDDTKPIEGALAPKKQYPWIAARIDAEYYQAQVQDLAAHAAPSAQAIEGTRDATSSCHRNMEGVLFIFLVVALSLNGPLLSTTLQTREGTGTAARSWCRPTLLTVSN